MFCVLFCIYCLLSVACYVSRDVFCLHYVDKWWLYCVDCFFVVSCSLVCLVVVYVSWFGVCYCACSVCCCLFDVCWLWFVGLVGVHRLPFLL